MGSRPNFYLRGKKVNEPLDYEEFEIQLTAPEGSSAPNLETSEITWVNEEAAIIRDQMFNGLSGGSGFFQGIPFNYGVAKGDQEEIVLEAFLRDYRIINPVQSACRVDKSNGIDTLEKRLAALTAQFLVNEGVITGSDYVEVQVIKEEEIEEALLKSITAAITIYQLSREIQESIRKISKLIAEIVGYISTGSFGSLAAALYAILVLILNAVFIAAMIIIIINLLAVIFEALLPPVVKDKSMTLRTLMSKFLEHLGFSLESNIPGLEFVYYASKTGRNAGTFEDILPKWEGRKEGIPNNSDFGFFGNDLLSFILQTFNANIGITGKKVYIYQEVDDFWFRTSKYKMPDFRDEQIDVNFEELFANRVLSFSYDLSDFWTVENFTGTNTEIITTPIFSENDDHITIAGLDQINLPLALGNRKEKLNGVEKILTSLAEVADAVMSVFGSSQSYADKIKARTGQLKKSAYESTVPKLLAVKGSKLAKNHRDQVSAQAILRDYHFSKSFVQEGFIGQKHVHVDKVIPHFTFKNLLELSDNMYFVTDKGERAKFERIVWNEKKDQAVGTWWVRKPFTFNLQEQIIIP
jgi:hypothetical protein